MATPRQLACAGLGIGLLAAWMEFAGGVFGTPPGRELTTLAFI